ncbi:MAG: V-type ATP synthase subunit B, partial [Nitrospiraceae bacterium]
MRLSEHRYRTISSIAGPLLFVQGVFSARLGEVVKVLTPDKRQLDGEVLQITGDTALIEVFAETRGLDLERTTVVFTDSVRRAPLSPEIIGRVFNGSFVPLDGLPMFIPEKRAPITGLPMNPTARARPEEFIETGLSVIDGLNTLVKGQKLPVFSCSGLPSKEVVAAILRNSRTIKEDPAPQGNETSAAGSGFIVVFAALGLTFRDYSYYMNTLKEMRSGFVAFVNMADEPAM